jgi:Neutral/alkaline non-lysosomal ceramidase, N-terminal
MLMWRESHNPSTGEPFHLSNLLTLSRKVLTRLRLFLSHCMSFSAYQGLAKGEIYHSEGLLFNASINRSPSSYLLNPEKERKKYEKEGNTDKRMLQLRFTSGGEDIGLLNWFSVHATSMNNTNQVSRQQPRMDFILRRK